MVVLVLVLGRFGDADPLVGELVGVGAPMMVCEIELHGGGCWARGC